VLAWAPPAESVDNLRFRLELRDAELVRELLGASLMGLVDFGRLCPGAGPPPPGYAEAQAGLLAALAQCRHGGSFPDEVRRAAAAYEAAAQRELVGPLLEWALASDDPAVRAAGAELANAAGLLHRMAPLLAGTPGARLGWAPGVPAWEAELFRQYLALVSRFGGLLRDLARWREGP
jgi:hypothetical protein